MFSPSYLEGIPIPLEKAFRELEIRIMEDIVRRLKNNAGEIIRSADWQIYRLHELGESKKAIREYIKDALNLSEKELEKIYSGPLAEGYAYDEALYKAVGKDFIRFEDNEPLQQLIRAVIRQTNSACKNITQSLGFAVKKNGVTSFTPIADFYQQTLDGAVLDIASGAFDYNTVLKRTVKELTNSGLRTVDYASGYSNRVPVAARRAVMTGFNQTVARINDDNARELETDTFEVTWHSGHRPSHWWGGGWYTKQQLVSVCGLGSVDGLCGSNCYHNYFPVIPGVSVPTYSAEELEQMRADELKTTEYDGKQYTKYEALQRQRRLETKMRAQRQEINLLKEGGADEDDIIAARCRYRGTSAEYVRFSEAMGIPQQRERVTVDGLGNIGVGKWKTSDKSVAKSQKAVIMKAGSDNVALENQRYGRNKSTLVNKTYIDSGEYKRKYDNATDNQAVNKSLYDCAKKALKHRSGTAFEDMYWIDSNTGKILLSVTDSEDERAIVYTDKIMNIINGKQNIITIHTHPSSMPPSISDLNSCCKNNYKVGFIACHNGRVFGYTSNEVVNERIYSMYIENYIKEGYSEFDSQKKALEKLSHSYDIKIWEVLL